MSGSLPRWFRSFTGLVLFVCFAMPAWSQGAKRAVREGEHDEADQPRQREEYFRRGRTQLGESGARLRYRAYRDKMKRRAAMQAGQAAAAGASSTQQIQSSASAPVGGPWVSLGPAPITVDPSSGQDFGLNAGRLTSVVVDQNDPTGNTVYIGAAYGGVWKSTNAAAFDANSVQWTPLIDDQPTLAVGAIALKPDDSSTILVGTGETNQSRDSYYGLGILRSTDGGSTWTLVTSADNGVTPFQGVGFSKIAFSTAPGQSNLVVATASSTNATNVNLTNNNNIVGLYYSQDAGATWTTANVNDAGATTTRGSTSSVIYHPGLQKWFAAIRYHGMYSSPDGINFTRLTVQPFSALTTTACPAAVSFSCPFGRAEIALSPNSNDMYVWIVDESDTNKGMFKTSNGGSTWTSISTATGLTNCGDTGGGCGTQQGTYNLELAAVPNGPNVDLYAGAVNIFKCTLTAANPACAVTGSWINLTRVYGSQCSIWGQPANVHPDQHGVDYSHANPSIIYFANDGGIYRTLNGLGLNGNLCTSNNPFDDLNANLGSITEEISFSEHPTDAAVLLAGSQDNGSQATNSANSGTLWNSVNSGDGGFNAIDPVNPNIWYTANTDVSIQRCTLGTSCNAGSFTSAVSNSNVGGDAGDFYTPYILDPGLTSRIIVGTCRVWRGSASGGSLTALSLNFQTFSSAICTGSENNLVSALAAGGPVTPGVGSKVIYAGTYGGNVYVTTNAGTTVTTWSNLFVGNANVKVSSIEVDQGDPTGQTAYATVMGFGVPHVYKTTNALVWNNISGDLPDVPVDSVAVDPLDSNVIYVGTDVGVFVTTNGGVNWTEWGTGMPNAPVTRMRTFVSADKSQKKLRVSTYGRGVWQTDLFTATPIRASVSPASVTAFVNDPGTFTVTVFAQGGFNGSVTVTCDGGGNLLPATCVGATVSPAASGTPVTVTVTDPSASDFNFSIKVVASDPGSTTVELPVVLHTVDLSLSVPSPPSVTMKRGTTSSPMSFTLTGLGQLQTQTQLSCSGMPAGAQCIFQPSPFISAANGASVDITLVVSSTLQTAVGTFSPSIVATNSLNWSETRTQPFSLEVDLNPDFTMAANPTVLTPAVLSSTVTVDSRDGYTGNVTLSCSIDLPGPTCSMPAGAISVFPGQATLTINPNGTDTGTFTVTVTGDDGAHTNSVQLQLRFPDFMFYTPNGTTSKGFSGGTGTYSLYVEPLNFYPGQIQVTCDSTAISPSSTCSANPPVVSGFSAVTVTYTVPSSVQAGTFPVHIHAQGVGGSPAHNMDFTATVMGFTLAQLPPTSVTLQFDMQALFNVQFTPTGGYGGNVTFNCSSTPFACGGSNGTTYLGTPTNVPIAMFVGSDVPPGVLGNGIIQFTVSGNPLDFPGNSVTAPGAYTVQIQDFRVAMPSHNYNVLPGSTLQIPLSVESFGNNGSFSLGCSGLPAGSTCSFNPSTIGPTGGASMLTVTIPSSAPLTNYASFVRVTSNSISHQALFYLGVFNFTQSVTPSTAMVAPGGTANFTVNYGGSVSGPFTVGCGSVPAGVTCAANPSITFAGQPATVTVTTTAGVTPSTNTINILGTTLGVTRTTPVTVRVADFSFTSTTSSGAANAGTAAPVSLRATAVNGFNSSVTMSCPPVATGISCTFTPASLVPLSTGSVITASILSTAATPPGVYTVPLTATASGVSHVINYTLTVKNFHGTVQPTTAITPVGGGTAKYTLTLFADQGFASVVTPSCATPLPTGVTCAFSPTTLTPTLAGASTTLTATVASTAGTATDALTIRATASPLVQTFPITLLTGADFSITPASSTQTVQQTQDATYPLTLTAIGGMNQPVTLSCTGLPTGGTCLFDNNPVTPTAQGLPVNLTVKTTLASVPGTYNISVKGTSGGLSHTVTAVLNLQVFPDFVLGSAAPLVGIRPGQTAMFNATATKNGTFSSAVNLGCAGSLPSGANCLVSPSSVDFSTVAAGAAVPVSVSVSTPGNTPLGDSAFTLHGVEQGGTGKIHDQALTLRVNDFHLSPPSSLTFAQTDVASYPVTVFADNLFNLPVTLSCNNLPASLGPCAFSQNNFVPAAGGTTVTVTTPVAANAPVGPTTFDVIASTAPGGNSTSHTVTENLNIILVQDFVLSTPAPLTLTTTPGQGVGWPLSLTPLNSFSANVNLSVTGCPAGFTCSFSPAPPMAISNQTPQGVNFIVQVPTTAAATNSNVTVTATDPVSGKTHSLILTISVQNFSVSVTPTSRSVAPGAGAQYSVTLNALNGFNQQVLVGCGAVPAFVSCSMPVALQPGQSGTLTVMTATGITAGTKLIPIGGALGLQNPIINPTNASLAVSSTLPTFTLTTSAATRSTPVNTALVFPVMLRATSTSFTSTVALSCVTTLPITCGFSANNFRPTTIATNVNVTVTPGAQLSPGSYPFIIRGLGGTQVRQLAMTLNVTDFNIVANPSTQTIVATSGGTTSYTVSAFTGSNFATVLTLSCPGLPAGWNCAFVPPTITPTLAGANSTLTLTTTALPAGPTTFTVQASGSGLTHQTTAQVINGQDFSLSAAPNSLTVPVGGSNSTSIGVTAIGTFSTAPSLSCLPVSPAPVTGSLSCSFPSGNAPLPGASVPLQLSATANLPGGVYTVTVKGDTANLSHAVPVTVSVPDYSLTLAPDASVLEAMVGSPALMDGLASSLGGYSGTINLACSAAPPLSCANVPASTTAGPPFTFNATIPGNTVPGSYQVQLNGNDGSLQRSATYNLAVRDFSVGLTTGSGTIEAGTSTTVSGTVTGLNNFARAVLLQCPPDPNITCVFTPSAVTASAAGTPFSVTITAAPITPPGGYTVNVSGTFSGTSRTAPYSLTVTPTNDFNMGVGSPSATIISGTGTNFSLQFTAINAFNASVTVTCSGAPAGMTCTPPVPVAVPPGGAANLAIATNASVIAPGTYNLTVTGSGGGKTHSQNLSVAVQDFAISAGPASQQVQLGVEADYSVGMSSTSGYSVDALFTCSIAGSPAGMGCSFDQPDLTAGGSTTLRVTTSASTPSGTYAVNVVATSGSLVHSGSVTIVAGVPDFSLSASGAPLVLSPGLSGPANFSIMALAGFNSSVTFTCSASTSLSCTAPTALVPTGAGTPSSVLVKASKSVLAGGYTVTLTGTGGGKTHTLTLPVTVSP